MWVSDVFEKQLQDYWTFTKVTYTYVLKNFKTESVKTVKKIF